MTGNRLGPRMAARSRSVLSVAAAACSWCQPWAAAGQALYLEGASRGVWNLWKVAVDPETLRILGGPERLTVGAGRDTDLTLSQDGKKLAFAIRSERTRIWSLPFAADMGQITG